MEEKHLKEISNKLTAIIKLLISTNEKYKDIKAETILKLLDGTGLSDKEISDIGGIALQTIANTRSRMKSGGVKKGKKDGK